MPGVVGIDNIGIFLYCTNIIIYELLLLTIKLSNSTRVLVCIGIGMIGLARERQSKVCQSQICFHLSNVNENKSNKIIHIT